MTHRPTITLYTAPECHYCRLLRRYLKKRNIPFEEHDVSVEHDRWTEMIQRSGQLGVPVITIGSEVIVGFDRKRIEEALDARKGAAARGPFRRAHTPRRKRST